MRTEGSRASILARPAARQSLRAVRVGWHSILVGVGYFATLVAMPQCAQAEEFRRLPGAEIRTQVTGMQITDEVHWTETYERGGRLLASDMGHPSAGSWRIKGDLLCIQRPGFDACYEVWLAAPKIQLRVPGDRNFFTAVLRRPAAR